MKIEAGKYYKTRDGRKVGPMRERDEIVSYGYWAVECDGYIWESNTGKNYPNRLGKSDYPELDLIAEWTDEQIGTLAELDVKPGDVVEWLAGHRTYTVDEDGILRHDDGGYISHTAPVALYRLISRATPKPSIDLTAIREPFGLLDKATQDAMMDHPGPHQKYVGDGEWIAVGKNNRVLPGFVDTGVYRVAPSPKRETVTKDAAVLSNGSIVASPSGNPNCTITYNTIDGEIDMATYRVVAK